MRTGWNSLEEQFSERDLLTYRLSAPPLPPPRRAFFFSIFLFCFLFFPFNFFCPFLLLFYFLEPFLPISNRNRRWSEDTDRGGGSGIRRQEGDVAARTNERGWIEESRSLNETHWPIDSSLHSYPTLLPARFSFHATLASAFLPPCVCWRAASANS